MQGGARGGGLGEVSQGGFGSSKVKPCASAHASGAAPHSPGSSARWVLAAPGEHQGRRGGEGTTAAWGGPCAGHTQALPLHVRRCTGGHEHPISRQSCEHPAPGQCRSPHTRSLPRSSRRMLRSRCWQAAKPGPRGTLGSLAAPSCPPHG